MAAVQEPAAAPGGTPPPAPPGSKENEDPTEPSSLRKMFFEGNTMIGTHRTENLFQALEQRTLTEEEERVIEERVNLQRRMFEEYERRELRRKVSEVQEVCPDLNDKEVEAALRLSDGREDEAAASLTSDPAFLRRVKSEAGTGPAPQPAPRQQPTRNPNRSRPAGQRPKVVDPSSLQGSVFCGTFRGKGFSGSGSRRNRAAEAATAAAAATGARSASEGEKEDEETETESEAEEQEAAVDTARGRRTSARHVPADGPGTEAEREPATTPEAAAAVQAPPAADFTPGKPSGGEAGGGAGSGSPPPTVPKLYALVTDTEEGNVRPVTDTELRQVQRALSGAAPAQQLSPAAAAPVADAQQEEKVEREEAPGPSSARRPQRAAAVAAAAAVANESSKMVTASMLAGMASKLESLEDAKAVAWLSKMGPSTAAAALEQLGTADPERAVMLRELLDAGNAQQQEKEQIPGSTAAAVKELLPVVAAADKQAPITQETHSKGDGGAGAQDERRDSPRRATAAKATTVAATGSEEGWVESSDDERTVTEGSDFEEEPRSARARKARGAPPSASRAGRPQRAAKAAALARSLTEASDEEEATDDDMLPASEGEQEYGPPSSAAKRRQRNRRPPGNKRQKSEEAEEPGVASTAANPAAAPVLAAAVGGGRRSAISSRGHTNRGRVRQKSHKSADLVDVGTLRAEPGWFNAGYIFPAGFQSRTHFRSSVALDQLCVHECTIEGAGGKYWPAPTFKVVALDRPDDPLIAKSCTGCWSAILRRINAEIEARRREGEDLPPPPKTAIAGPEYFGLNQPNIVEAIEALDPAHLCTAYWNGKQDRQAVAAGLPVAAAPARAPRAPRAAGGGGSGGGGRRGSRRRRGSGSDSDDGKDGSDDEEGQYVGNKWSAVERADRYRKRLEDNGEDASAMDEDNPLPDLTDPITLEPVVRPAISPYGHVMGAATWRAVLAESGVCPFTKQPLRWEHCRILTKHNIDAFRDKIIR